MPSKGKRSRGRKKAPVTSAPIRPVPLLPLLVKKNEDYLICPRGSTVTSTERMKIMNDTIQWADSDILASGNSQNANNMFGNGQDMNTIVSEVTLSKKDRHIRAEHRRRLGLQDRLQKLRSELPHPYRNAKLTKLEIIQKAAEYISSLQVQLALPYETSSLTEPQQSFVIFPTPALENPLSVIERITEDMIEE